MASTSKFALRPPPIHRSSPLRPPRQCNPRFRPHPRRVHLQSASCRGRHRLWGRDSPEESPAGEDPSFDWAVSLFNGGDYYRCHDSLEELWYGAEEPVRTLLQGLLQCAVGFHHLFNQNHRGAMMELGEGLCKLRKLDFVSGPFFQFEQEVSAALEFLYQTQKELAASAFGAVLHVISTSLLGITAITMANTIAGEETVHRLASLLLLFLGGSYILLYAFGKGGHSHSHNHPMEKMAVAGLVLVPALSPCATTLPVFLAVGNSSSMMVLAIIVLLFSTITVMTSLVALSFYGASQLKFHWVERYDKLLVGSVLCLVGILTYVFHDHDGEEHPLGEHLHRKLIAL